MAKVILETGENQISLCISDMSETNSKWFQAWKFVSNYQ